MPDPDGEILALLDPEGEFPARLAADRRRLLRLARRLWTVPPLARQRRLAEIETLAHRLAGAAGTFDFAAVSEAALALEEGLIEQREGVLAGELCILDSRVQALAAALAQAL